jgi:histo-blood group ABO system transferase
MYIVLLAFISLFSLLEAHKVGLFIMATGRYIEFVNPLIDSADKYFCKDHEVTYFVFTDQELEPRDNVVKIYQKRLGWPNDTMKRYHVYYENRDYWKDMDYVFALDADMLFVSDVGNEILGERVATLHPGFVGKVGPHNQTSVFSNAYIPKRKRKKYFAGGFYGGSKSEVLKIFEHNIAKIDDDLSRGVIATWHDESHWNKYCSENPPTVILNPSYCYPESLNLKYEKKLLALDKLHEEFRK